MVAADFGQPLYVTEHRYPVDINAFFGGVVINKTDNVILCHRHSVNFPEAIMPRNGRVRLLVANANVPNMVGQISTCLAEAELNIADLLNRSRGDLAYTLVDVDSKIGDATLNLLSAIEGVLSVRVISG